jgi:hypothetical protein
MRNFFTGVALGAWALGACTLVLCVVLSCVVLSCGDVKRGQPQPAKPYSTVTDGRHDASFQEVTLRDGTVCVIMLGNERGGISCNWVVKK